MLPSSATISLLLHIQARTLRHNNKPQQEQHMWLRLEAAARLTSGWLVGGVMQLPKSERPLQGPNAAVQGKGAATV